MLKTDPGDVISWKLKNLEAEFEVESLEVSVEHRMRAFGAWRHQRRQLKCRRYHLYLHLYLLLLGLLTGVSH